MRLPARAATAAAALGAAAAILGAACSSPVSAPAPPPARNLIVVSIDTLRADHLSAYGYPRATTPLVDDLAREGTLFASAHAHSNWTVPSTASLLTSLYPSEHGAGIAGEMRLLGESTPILQIRDGVETLATRLHRAGLRTGLFSANPFLFGSFENGFDAAEVGRKNAAALTTAALAWLDRAGEGRFFLYLQYMDLHHPVEPPPPFFDLFPVAEGGVRGREHGEWSFANLRDPRDLDDPAFRRYRAHRVALYDGALRFVDEEIRRLYHRLERTGRAEQTLVVITSDHGEEFWDHALAEHAGGNDPRGFWGVGHGHTMYEELLHVPLVLRGPGVAGGRRVPCPVRQVDVVPTVLELLGLAPLSGTRGRSLVPLLRRGREPEGCVEAPLVAESPAYGPDSRAVTWRGRKLVSRRDGVASLFDLRADPGERRDLAGADPRLAAALRSLLERELAPAAERARPQPVGLDEATKRELRALGYLR